MSCKLFSSGWKVMWSFSMFVCFSNLTIIGPSFLILSRWYTQDTRLDKLFRRPTWMECFPQVYKFDNTSYEFIKITNPPMAFAIFYVADQRTTFGFQLKLHLIVNSCCKKQRSNFTMYAEFSARTTIHLVFQNLSYLLFQKKSYRSRTKYQRCWEEIVKKSW